MYNKNSFFSSQRSKRQQFCLASLPRSEMGSGVIVSEDGLVLTNAHVVARAYDTTPHPPIAVTMSNEKTLYADVVGYFPKVDLALLQLQLPVRTVWLDDCLFAVTSVTLVSFAPLTLFHWWSPSGETFGNLRSLILSSKSAFVLFRSLLLSQIKKSYGFSRFNWQYMSSSQS